MDGTAELSKKGGRCGGTHDTHITMDATAERQGGSMVNATQYDYDLLFYDRYYPEHADSALKSISEKSQAIDIRCFESVS